ncbi:metal ABC transporter substrate-binding protein [Mailhella massiliensis]|uniref:metal ABC transporter substrate-binding protein n=1 Tax=Mailhella massiliensis TaxID=1903261 RepID=UPI0023F22781|nr:metal ABC transporter substrate-binding protein [Mailhella massiliensis]
MKTVLSLLVCLVLGLSAPTGAAAREITASVFPVWLLLREVARDVPDAHVSLLLPPGTGCPHDYAMTPQDRRGLARADVLVINGLGLESFLGEKGRVEELMKKGSAVIDVSRGVEGLMHDEDDDHGHNHGGVNPHIFASPAMMERMAASLAEQLAALDPANAALYGEGGRRAAALYAALAEECRATGARLAGKGVLVQHEIFSYLARDMGLRVDGVIRQGEGLEPSARGMLTLVRAIREKGTSAVITEPQYPDRAGKTLAAETGITCITLDPMASGPEDAPLDYYENVMRENLRILEQALGS